MTQIPIQPPRLNFHQAALQIKSWGQALGFQQVAITSPDLSDYEADLKAWLAKNYHGEMKYMEKYGLDRANPSAFVPEVKSIIMVRMNYLPPDVHSKDVLQNKSLGYISRYTLGRDYHKVLRKKLKSLAQQINDAIQPHEYRVFTDSGPIMEKPLGEKAGLGWIGKNTLLIHPKTGSWFFLGALLTSLPLPSDPPQSAHCGSCSACIRACPTQAIVGPKQLDARRCISYLTIEFKGSIPLELRPLMGNRIYGCDDCQLVCPWNKFARYTDEKDFYARPNLASPTLLELFAWTEDEFLKRTEGSAMRRVGFECWLRNIAVALGNAPTDPKIMHALENKRPAVSALVAEHIDWALAQQRQK